MGRGIETENNITALAFSRGDLKALNSYYNKYYNALLLFAEKLIRNNPDAEDLVIDSFHKLWLKKEDFASEANIRAFLWTAVKNACFSYLRHQETKAKYNSEVRHSGEFAEIDIEARIIRAEHVADIYQAIENLSPSYREVINLLFFEGKSFTEVASLLNTTSQNIRKRKERAIAELRINVFRRNSLTFTFTLMLAIRFFLR